MDLLWFLIIGGIAGWLAGKVINGGGSGILMNVIIGIIGAVIGGRLFVIAGLSFGGLIGSLVSAFVGAVVLLWLIKLIKK